MDQGGRDMPKQVKFHNPNFKRGRKDLLSNIFRSTRKNGSVNNNKQQGKEILNLKSKVTYLEGQLARMEASLAVMQHQMREMFELQAPFPQHGQNTGPIEVQSSSTDTTTWPGIESNEKVGDVATLDPSPHVKEMDPSRLPPPPPPPIRSMSLLRGFSSDFSKSDSRLFADLMADNSAY